MDSLKVDMEMTTAPERVVRHDGDTVASLQYQSFLAPRDGWSRFTFRDTVHEDSVTLLHRHVTQFILEDRRTSNRNSHI